MKHQYLRLHARELARIYRGLASELVTAAHTLEHSDRPEDSYPTVKGDQFTYAIDRGAVLHFILDEVIKDRKRK